MGGALKLQGARERGGAVERPRRQGGRGHRARVSPVAIVTMTFLQNPHPVLSLFLFYFFKRQQTFLINWGI